MGGANIDQTTLNKMLKRRKHDNGVPEIGKISITSGLPEIGGQIKGKTKIKGKEGNNVGFNDYTVINGTTYVPNIVGGKTAITRQEDEAMVDGKKPLRKLSTID